LAIVELSSVEDHLTHSGVGTDLRKLRKSRGLKLAELALMLGRSIGWLSQIERGISEPTIDDLRNIGQVFDKPISFFFQTSDAPANERGVIVRANQRRKLGNPDGDLVEELLSPDLGGDFLMLRSTFAAGSSLPNTVTRETEEEGTVIAGTLDLCISGIWHTLNVGDSFRFSHEPFQWRNSGSEPATVIWTISPPIY